MTKEKFSKGEIIGLITVLTMIISLTVFFSILFIKLDRNQAKYDTHYEPKVEHYWSIENYSASDIIELMQSYTTIKTGDNVQEWISKFDIEPTNVQNRIFLFTNNALDTNYIDEVTNNTVEEMDGTYTVDSDSKIRFVIVLDDYDKAVEVYDKCYSIAAKDSKSAYDFDNRSTTRWSSFTNRCSFSMTKRVNNYEVAVELPIQDRGEK